MNSVEIKNRYEKCRCAGFNSLHIGIFSAALSRSELWTAILRVILS